MTTEATTTRDYLTYVDRDGHDLDRPEPMRCNDCTRPAYYDRADENYHHAINAGIACWLIRSESRPDDRMHPLLDRADHSTYECGYCHYSTSSRYTAQVIDGLTGKCPECNSKTRPGQFCPDECWTGHEVGAE